MRCLSIQVCLRLDAEGPEPKLAQMRLARFWSHSAADKHVLNAHALSVSLGIRQKKA